MAWQLIDEIKAVAKTKVAAKFSVNEAAVEFLGLTTSANELASRAKGLIDAIHGRLHYTVEIAGAPRKSTYMSVWEKINNQVLYYDFDGDDVNTANTFSPPIADTVPQQLMDDLTAIAYASAAKIVLESVTVIRKANPPILRFTGVGCPTGTATKKEYVNCVAERQPDTTWKIRETNA